ncbi:MAG: hypothetical protein KGH72_05330 [Candidatus Micrarchaeota archaeon]|nr:hypothetical protein [Candidatus Micrarchaeota archaeon]
MARRIISEHVTAAELASLRRDGEPMVYIIANRHMTEEDAESQFRKLRELHRAVGDFSLGIEMPKTRSNERFLAGLGSRSDAEIQSFLGEFDDFGFGSRLYRGLKEFSASGVRISPIDATFEEGATVLNTAFNPTEDLFGAVEQIPEILRRIIELEERRDPIISRNINGITLNGTPVAVSIGHGHVPYLEQNLDANVVTLLNPAAALHTDIEEAALSVYKESKGKVLTPGSSYMETFLPLARFCVSSIAMAADAVGYVGLISKTSTLDELKAIYEAMKVALF